METPQSEFPNQHFVDFAQALDLPAKFGANRALNGGVVGRQTDAKLKS